MKSPVSAVPTLSLGVQTAWLPVPKEPVTHRGKAPGALFRKTSHADGKAAAGQGLRVPWSSVGGGKFRKSRCLSLLHYQAFPGRPTGGSASNPCRTREPRRVGGASHVTSKRGLEVTVGRSLRACSWTQVPSSLWGGPEGGRTRREVSGAPACPQPLSSASRGCTWVRGVVGVEPVCADITTGCHGQDKAPRGPGPG